MEKSVRDTTRLQPVVVQFHTYNQKGAAVSFEIEVPPAEAWWCPINLTREGIRFS